MRDSLTIFDPVIRDWFLASVGRPTDAQSRAWPEIAAGRHVLVTAPTGSGKTFTAFLWALNQLLTGAWPPGAPRVLYVSPLRALNNDIQRNLLAPLAELTRRFRDAGRNAPELAVLTRSGDTPPHERQRMVRRPPDILITTPESLSIMLSSPRARMLFAGLRTVILDEIHAVAGAKRGTHLITSVERIVPMAGEFQRIALSATVRPLETIAAFVGGYRATGEGVDTVYEPRPVAVLASRAEKRLEVEVRFPADDGVPLPDGTRMPGLMGAVEQVIREHRSTLVFTNSRRMCERATLLINDAAGELVAYSHHGSLSRELRAVVEQRLKNGELKAIVATNSLELGIDIGALDRVVLLQTPFSVASALQRIGRAGHQVGAVSRGMLFPTHERDVLEAAVMARAVAEQDIEPCRPVTGALDVLAQVIVAMAGVESWNLDALFRFIRTCWPYRELSRRQFNLVVDMLAGRYAESRLRALSPVLSLDRISDTLRGTSASLRLLYLSGGTIPDRGYYGLRRADSRAKIGELDEEFVWERRVGQTFTLGAHAWTIQEITHNDVLVVPGDATRSEAPFWRAEDLARPFHFSQRIAAFLERAEKEIERGGFEEMLEREYALAPEAAEKLARFLKRQRAATGAPLPHRRHLLVEYTAAEPGSDGVQAVLHTLWGGALNQPFALALAQAWEETHGYRVEVFANNDCVALMLPEEIDAQALLGLVKPERIEALLRKRLEQSGYFGARFRENAGIALQLPRRGFGQRMPLWLNRRRAQKLLHAVMKYPDFPILAETWRTCLCDDFDLANLRRMLDELHSGATAVSGVLTRQPSPFAESMLWRQTNLFMYVDDTPMAGPRSRLSDELLAEVARTAALRPAVPASVVAAFEAKSQRLHPGYAPLSAADLLDWVKERLLLAEAEWKVLLAAVKRDANIEPAEIAEALRERVVWVEGPGRTRRVVAAIECVPRMARAFGWRLGAVRCFDLAAPEQRIHPVYPEPAVTSPDEPALAGWLAEWLRFFGPVRDTALHEALPVAPGRIDGALEELTESGALVVDRITRDASGMEICDAENLETLLRMGRAAAHPSFTARPAEELPLFLAQWQGVLSEPAAGEGRDPGRLETALERLFGCPLAAELLEGDVLPARVPGYHTAALDALTQQTGLMWFGCGPRRVAVGFSEHAELFRAAPEARSGTETALFPDPRGRYAFEDLLHGSPMDSAALSEALWRGVWEGRVANDSFEALRRGLQTRFRPATVHATHRPIGRRRAFDRWRATRPFAGAWYELPPPFDSADPLDREEANKERVRVLLDRYGVLFRELLDQEPPHIRWGALFRTLRLMELSGEVVAGQFFDGIHGPQFAAPDAFRTLQSGLAADAIYWLNAADPASLCGVPVTGLRAALPKRLASTHLVYQGTCLVAVSERNAARITFHTGAEEPRLPDYLGVFEHLLARSFLPRASLRVETINGSPAKNSPYLDAFRRRFDVAPSPGHVTLRLRT